MANPIYCDQPPCDQPADFLVSNLNEGQPLALCGPHMLDWCQAFLQAFATLEPEPGDTTLPEHPVTDEPSSRQTQPGAGQGPKSDPEAEAAIDAIRDEAWEDEPAAADTG